MTKELLEEINSETVIAELIAKQFERTDHGLGIEELVEVLAGDVPLVAEGDTTKVVSLIGGAASGKSTLAHAIVTELRSRGFASDTMGTDDYVVGNREYRREHYEGKDPKAKYDFALLNAKVAQIKNIEPEGCKVPVPTYDPLTGVAIAQGEENFTHRIGKLDALLVEGDFDELVDADLRIYVHVPDHLRLNNRVNRDVIERGEAEVENIKQNFYLRHQSQHVPYTLPAAETADLLVVAKLVEGTWRYDVYQAIYVAQNS